MSCIKNERIRHNADVIASTIIEMICNDLKFHDMQNNTEYLLLQSVLKEQKKRQIKEEKRRKKLEASGKDIKKIEEPKRKSKFKEKYKDRVEAIQHADSIISENRKLAEENNAENNKSREPFRRKKKRKK